MKLHELDKNSKFGYRRKGWSSHTGYIAFVNEAWVYITYRNDIEELTSYHTTATDWLLSDTPNRYYTEQKESPFPCFRARKSGDYTVMFTAEYVGEVVDAGGSGVFNVGYVSDNWVRYNNSIWEPCGDPRQKRKFKVGDVVSRYKNGNTYIIVAVEDGRYRTSNGRYFIFRHENRWELVQSTTPSNLQAEKPEIAIGSHWERVEPRSLLDNIICINGIEDERVTWGDYNKSVTIEYLVQNFTPRPDLDSLPITDNTSCSSEPIPTQQKQKENKMDLRLLLAMMAAMSEEETPKDATNSQYVVIVTKDDEYEGYFYSDCLDEVEEIVAKPSNELKKFHVFDYSTTLAQKPRKVVQVERS